MTKIDRIYNVQNLKKVWERLFTSADPFTIPFHSNILDHIIFYPTYGYHLTKQQYNALVKSSQAIGEKGFNISIIEFEGNYIERGEHWWCKYPSYNEYLKLPLVLENALYSPNSEWGLIVSHEDHAIVGGNIEFMSTVKRKYPQWTDDVRELIKAWKDNPYGKWVEDMISKLGYKVKI